MSRSVEGRWVAPTLLVGLALQPMMARAQEALPTLPEVLAEVQDTEVFLQGVIGRGPEGGVRFVLPGAANNGFSVFFESAEDLEAAIEGCGFDGSGGLPCKLDGYGYLIWEGARLKVVLTRIETLGPPTKVEK